MAPQIAWLGLGNMGRGMSKNLVEKGNLGKPLILWNRTTKRAEDLAAKIGSDKTKVASTIEEATKESDIIFLCLGDDKAVDEALTTLLSQDIKGKLIVDCSTIHPDSTNANGKKITETGASFVAGPVFGAPAMADNGQLIFILAGPAADVEKVKPYTKGVMGREVIAYADQEYGHATLLKLIGNTFILQMVEALAEGHVVAEKTGLGPENLHKWIGVMFPGPYTAYSQRMLNKDHIRDEPLFQVDLAKKDARHALDLAGRAGAKMKAVEVADEHLTKVKEAQGQKGDLAGIYGAVRLESGLEF